MATIVLVPGAWCGGWSWKFVTSYLREAGHEVHSATLTGMGDRIHLAHPDVDLDTHVQDIVNILEYEDLRDTILVGWSYGAMVVVGAAHRVPDRIARLVILDSHLVPDDGQSVYDIEPEYRADDEALLRDGNGWQLPSPPESAFRLSIPDTARREWFCSRLTPMPARTQSQPIRLGHPAADGIPRTLIRCTHSPSWNEESSAQFLQGIQSDPQWKCLELDGRHIALVAQPRETADMLMKAIE